MTSVSALPTLSRPKCESVSLEVGIGADVANDAALRASRVDNAAPPRDAGVFGSDFDTPFGVSVGFDKVEESVELLDVLAPEFDILRPRRLTPFVFFLPFFAALDAADFDFEVFFFEVAEADFEVAVGVEV